MYKIKKISPNFLDFNMWCDIPFLSINNFPWDTTGYKPATEVKLCYTDNDLFIQFTSQEKTVRVEETNFNGGVYKDSCVEFFFKPLPFDDERYFNFEMSAAGVLLLQLDDKTRDRSILTDVDPSIFEIDTDINIRNKSNFNNFKPWHVEYKIPFDFIRKYFPRFNPTSGHTISCNFYKCGDKTEIAHYGCWNKITYHKPSFHRPEYFGEIMFE